MTAKKPFRLFSGMLNIQKGSVPSLLADLDKSAARSRFKEMIEIYKELLKRERKPEWVDGLASAYASRAQELASKGMLGEALEVWGNRSKFCDKKLLEGPYAHWLIRAGKTKELLTLLKDPGAVSGFPDAVVAGIVLSSPDNMIAALPENHPLKNHLLSAEEALKACSRGDYLSMSAHLDKIPFRSPCRDLKPILKALALIGTDPKEAASLLARVPEDSPFARLASTVRLSTLAPDRWLPALADLDDESRQLAMDLRGVPENLHHFVGELARLGNSPSPQNLLDLLDRFGREIPREMADPLWKRLLPHAPRYVAHYQRRFGVLSSEENLRLKALSAEIENDADGVNEHWSNLVRRLLGTCGGPGKPPNLNDKRVALIFRRVARMNLLIREKVLGLGLLRESLEHDPEDKDSYVTLIREFHADADFKNARFYLESALSRFPEDTTILLESVEMAIETKAYKKASEQAKKLLRQDPLNARARELITRTHLEHARKLFRAGKTDKARKEIRSAEEWARSSWDRASLEIILFLTSSAPPSREDSSLRSSLSALGDPLTAEFLVLLESERLHRDPAPLVAHLDRKGEKTPSPGSVVVLARRLRQMDPEDKAVKIALSRLKTPLSSTATGEFSASDDMATVCEAFLRHKEFSLAKAYADQALKRWSGDPLFLLLRTIATTKNDPERLSHRDIDLLDRASRKAEKKGDKRTYQRILSFLSPLEADEPYDDGPDLDKELPESPESVMRMMLAMMGAKAFLKEVQKHIPRDLYRQMRAKIGGTDQEFASAFIEVVASDYSGIKFF